MKRRALLAGLLLMPATVHARTPKQGAKKPSAQKPAAHRAAAPKPAAVKPTPSKPAGPPLPPLAEARTQLVAFNASAFPYRGPVPGSRKPFLDVRDGRRRGHTSLRGTVYWEDAAYSDRRSLLYLPQGFAPADPSLIVLYLHGQGATLERDVVVRQAVPRQVAESHANIALVAPQLAFDAGDSSAGNFWRPGFLATYLDETTERLMRLYGDRRAGPRFNAAPVVIVAYSGGYLSAAYMLAHGGAAHRIKGVILLDALYGEEDKFAAWVAQRRKQCFLLSAFTESTQAENATVRGLLAKRRIPHSEAPPAALTAGTAAFVDCGPWDRHGDFVTKAWTDDPLRHALASIPGYARADHAKKPA